MKIDICAHFLPPNYYNALCKHLGKTYPTAEANPALIDLNYRFRTMDKYDDLVQVLIPNAPPLEAIAKPKKAAELAKIANDSMAEVVSKYPDRFVAGVALIATNDINTALEELDRAINQLKLRGVTLFTPQYIFDTRATGLLPKDTKPIDITDLMPLYERMAEYNLPIWIHPYTARTFADYTTEEISKYQIWHMFGWIYHTTAAMTRLIFSGILDKYPGIKFITHHAGAMVPFCESRISVQYDYTEMRSDSKDKQELRERPIDYFRMFYGDTALNGSTAGLMCAYSFFGANHLLFGTDMPHDCQLGEISIRDTIKSIEQMEIADSEKKAIFEDNARKLLRLPV